MAKMFFFVAVFLVLAGVCFSTAHDGDGTYTLYVNDTVVSDNDFTIKLVNFSMYTGMDVPVPVEATYSISRSGMSTKSITLEQGESYTVSAASGTRNVTVTAEGMDSELEGGLVVVVVPYADTSVESSSYDPPQPDLKINSVDVAPSYFTATVTWKTNVSANGTVTLYDKDSDMVSKLSKSAHATTQSVTFSGLTSNSKYFVMVSACTDEWCVNSSKYNFTTLMVVPQITNVQVLAYGDTWANIYWETDVKTDESIYYRKQGTSEWEQVPSPSDKWDHMKDYVAYEPGAIYGPGIGPGGVGPDINPWEEMGGFEQEGISTAPAGERVNLAASDVYGYASMDEGRRVSLSVPLINIYEGIDVIGMDKIGVTTDAGSYAIGSNILAMVPNEEILDFLVREKHQINLKELDDQTTYEFKASSCADKCVNSSVYTFTTNRTLLAPGIEVVASMPVISHGTSEVIYVRVYSMNPGATITSISLDWNDNGYKSMVPKLDGDPLTFLPAVSGGSDRREFITSITFEKAGVRTITVHATDSIGMKGEKNITMSVLKSKTSCKNSNAIYYPDDTPCTNTWPYDAQGGFEYNTGIDKCHASEVCDSSLDYVIADAESCCNGIRSFSDEPTQNYGYGYDKNIACERAINNTRDSGGMTSLGPDASMKTCKASYLVYGLGGQAIYMKDYYTGEFCCSGSDSICPGLPHFTAAPWPESNIKFGGLKCVYTHVNWVVTSYNEAKKGWYASDTDWTQNSNSAVDLPPHSSINLMNTGTCVDYAFAVTTLLRKAGFGASDIMTMDAPCHAYNLVWLPGATKYTFIDTVGNSAGEFFTGGGWTWTCKGAKQSHCTFRTDKCVNDVGMFACPDKSVIVGC